MIYNNKLRFKLVFLVLAVFSSVSNVVAQEIPDNIWEQVPLRTQAQKDAGMFGGEGGQMVWGLSYAPSNPDILYMVTDTSQVWKSEDGGSTWQIKHVGFLANGGISLAVDPGNENIVFVAGSRHSTTVSNDIADGIYRTRNGGESWELVRPTHFYRTGSNKGGVNFAFAGTNTIYSGTHEEGLLKSTDGGDSWNTTIPPEDLNGRKVLDVRMNPQDSSVIFLATTGGLYEVTDSVTVVLEQIGTDLPSFPRVVAINNIDPAIMYVTAGLSGVYKSVDGGISFNAINNGLSPVGAKEATYLAISPVNPNQLYVSFSALGGKHQPFYTSDGGNNWYEPSDMDVGRLLYDDIYREGLHEGAYFSAPTSPHPVYENIAVTGGAGYAPQITNDGGDTWTYTGNGYSGCRAANDPTSFSWDPSNPDRYAIFAVDHGPFLTEDGGSTFRTLNVPRYDGKETAAVGAIDPIPGSGIIVTAVGGWSNQVIAITQDSGENWVQIGGTEDNYKFIAFHPQNPDIVYAGKYKSTDRGSTWYEITRKTVAMFPGNGDIVYSYEMSFVPGTTRNHYLTLYKSVDKGETWNVYGTSKDIGTSNPMDVAVDPQNENRIYVTGHWYGIRIWDGSQWVSEACGTGTYDLKVDAFGTCSTGVIIADPYFPNVVYVGKWITFYGNADGVYRSLDRGNTWENITFNLGPEFTPWSLSVNPHNGYVYVGSSHGTWRLPSPDNDGDGLNNYEEMEVGTDPFNPDSDNDGLNDGHEVQLSTDPLHPDTDKDGFLDGDDNAPLDIFSPNAEGWNLSRNSDFSTSDTEFSTADTFYIIVWSNVANAQPMKKAKYRIKNTSDFDHTENLDDPGTHIYTQSEELASFSTGPYAVEILLRDNNNLEYEVKDIFIEIQ